MQWKRILPAVGALTALVAISSCGEAVGVETGTPAALEALSGDAQSGSPGAALEQPVVVRVTDERGVPVRGALVTFRTASGSGTTDPVTVRTGAIGRAQAVWTLGRVVSSAQRLSATVERPGEAPLETVFTATATPTGPIPVITALAPEPITPQSTVVITGTALDLVNRVSIAGVTATVLSRTATELRAQLPAGAFGCGPTQNVNITLHTASGDVAQPHPLRLTPARVFNPGQLVLSSAADPFPCVDLPSGSRYLITITNIATDTALRAGVRVSAIAAGLGNVTSSATATVVGHGHGIAAAREYAHLRSAAVPTFDARAVRTATADPVPGDTVWMRVPRVAQTGELLCTGADSVRARVSHVTQRSIVMEDLANPLLGTVDTLFRALATEFDTAQYDIIRDYFADPLPDGMKLRMLFTRRANEYGVTGFVFDGDLVPRASCAASNEAPVFYGNVPTAAAPGYGVGTRTQWYWNMRPTVIHEAKHIAAHRARLSAGLPLETVWLEEATAMVAEEIWARRVFGYEQRGNVNFETSVGCEIAGAFNRPPCPGKPGVMFAHFQFLGDWMGAPATLSPLGPITPSDVSFYGSAWLYLRWLMDHSTRTETELLRAITMSPVTGTANIEARFARPHADALPQWAAAVALDDRAGWTVSPLLRVPSWDLRDVYSGLNREQPTLFPVAYPLRIRTLIPGAAATDVPLLRAGGTAYFEVVTGTTNVALSIAGIEGALPSHLRVGIVRAN